MGAVCDMESGKTLAAMGLTALVGWVVFWTPVVGSGLGVVSGGDFTATGGVRIGRAGSWLKTSPD